MRKNKVKKVLLISLVVLLAIGTLGMSLAFFGKDDFTWVKNKVEDAFVQEEETKENVNLISNSNFKINTSGVTTYNSENVTAYHTKMFDNWFSESAMGEGALLTITDNGLYAKISEDYSLVGDGGSTSTTFMVGQQLDEIDSIFGQTVTLTFSVDNVVYSKTFDFTEKDVHYSVGNVEGLSLLVCRYPTPNVSDIVLQFKAGFEGTVNWVQLQAGNVFTGYVAPTTEAVA